MSDSLATQPTTGQQVTPVRKRVIIGVPGTHFTHNFLLSWTKTLYALWESGRYEVIIAPGQSSFVSFARMKTLGLDVLRGRDQKVFNNMPFDVYVTLDSDIVFTPQQIMELIESTDTHPVVCGYYMMSDLQHYACVKDWNEEYFAKHGSFQFIKPEDVDAWKRETSATFMPVSYNGLGFWAMRKEALDALKYPFFNADLQRIETVNGTILEDLCSEDVAFCKNLQRAGYQIMLHTGLRVGHEKSVIL
jgi:hypothetical protein